MQATWRSHTLHTGGSGGTGGSSGGTTSSRSFSLLAGSHSQPSHIHSSRSFSLLERGLELAMAGHIELAIRLIIPPPSPSESSPVHIHSLSIDERPLPPPVSQAALLACAEEVLSPCTLSAEVSVPESLLHQAARPVARPAARPAAPPPTSEAPPSSRVDAATAAAATGSLGHPPVLHCLRLHGTLPSISLHVWPALLTESFSLVRFVLPAVSEALRPLTRVSADQRTKATGGVGGDGWREGATGGVGGDANARRDPIGSEGCERSRAVNDRGSTEFGTMAAASPLAAVTLQLHLPSVELHVHEQRPRPGDPADRSHSQQRPRPGDPADRSHSQQRPRPRDPADLLLAKLTGLTVCCDADPTAGVDADVYLGSLSVLDARRHVPEALALIVSLRAEAAMCPPPQLSASIVPVDLRPAGATRERARAAVGRAPVGKAAQNPSAAVGRAPVGKASQNPSASKPRGAQHSAPGSFVEASWKLPRHLIAIPGASASVDAPPKPLLRALVRPPDAHGTLAVRLVAVCQALGMQWNPGLIAALINVLVDLQRHARPPPSAPSPSAAGAPTQAPAQTTASEGVPASSSSAPLHLELELEATVGSTSISLNLEERARHLEKRAPEGAPLHQLVLILARDVGVSLALAQDGALRMALGATLGSIRMPSHSPPATTSFEVVRPIDREDAAVVVEVLKNEATKHVPDITVQSRPVNFEFRNQTLLQAVDYMDRGILALFTPLRPPGGKSSVQPLWRVSAPSATMRIPTDHEGVLEFLVGPVSVGCEVLFPRGIQTQKIVLRAQRVSAYVLRPPKQPTQPTAAEAVAASSAASDEAAQVRCECELVRSQLPLLEEMSNVQLNIIVPLRKVDGAKQGLPFMTLEVLATAPRSAPQRPTAPHSPLHDARGARCGEHGDDLWWPLDDL